MLLLLLSLPVWIALAVLTLTVCASTRQGDLNQIPLGGAAAKHSSGLSNNSLGSSSAERSPCLSLPEAPAGYGRPPVEDARQVAA